MTARLPAKSPRLDTRRFTCILTTVLAAAISIFVFVYSASATAVVEESSESKGTNRKITAVSVGIGGVFKPGSWTPVDVRLEGSAAGRLIVEVPDCEGVRAFFSSPVQEGAKRARCYIRPGHVKPSLSITMTVDDQSVCRASGTAIVRPEKSAGFLKVEYNKTDGGTPLGRFEFYEGIPANRNFTVVVTGRSAGILSAAGTVTTGDEPPVVVRFTDFEKLPDRWYGFDAVDSVAICSGDPRPFQTLQADSPSLRSLIEWMEQGGIVLLSVGERAEEILAHDSPLAIFTPGRFQEWINIHQGEALESYISSTLPIAASAVGGRLDWPVPWLTDISGQVEVAQGEIPLIIRTPRRFGRSVFLGVDLSAEPLKSWPDRDQLIARLLDWPGKEDTQLRGGEIPEGYIDMSGQLRSALDRYQRVTVVPFWVVWSLALLYILLVGPAAYYVLHKSGRRVVLAWTILPLLALLFCVGGYLLAVGFRPAGIAARQADLIDIDLATGHVRGISWLGLYSGNSERLDMSIRPAAWAGDEEQKTQRLVGFFGLAGGGFGGMSAPISESLGTMVGYRYNESLDRMSGVPLAVRSSRSFMADFAGETRSPIHAELSRSGDNISGEIVNFSGETFDDCMLVYKQWAYRIGELPPHSRVKIRDREGQVPLRTVLTGRERYKEKKQTKYRMISYNRLSTDPWYILRSISFFEILGGQPYTGLANQQTERFDLSGRLGADRAVLIARPVGSPQAAIWSTAEDRPIVVQRSEDLPRADKSAGAEIKDIEIQRTLPSDDLPADTEEQNRPAITMLRVIIPVESKTDDANGSM